MIYKVSERPVIIVIGQQGENDAENIQVDYTEWIEKYGSGIITAEYQRPDMSYPYPVTLTMVDGIATWTVSETDVTWEDSGNGSCGKMTGFVQLVYTVGEIVKKTVIWPVQVNRSLGASGPAPDPVQSWIDQMVELGAVVAENAAQAEQAAADAESYAEAAQSSANDADAAAEAAAASAEAAATAKSAAETAQAAAEAAQAAAEQARSEAEAAETGAEDAQLAAEAAQAAAEAAAQSATAAQNAAEAARDAAQAAQTAAEAARDAAQQYAEEAAEAAVNALIPFLPVDSASGAIASFPDGADDVPMLSLKAQIEPVQDLHGYDSPWPAGGGKNKYSDVWADYSRPADYYVCPISMEQGEWKLSGTLIGTAITGCVVGLVKSGTRYSEFVGQRNVLSTNGTLGNQNITVDSTFTDPHLIIYCTSETQFNSLFSNYHFQLEKSDSVTDYAPFENICPISGHTGVNISHSGADMTNPDVIPVSWESEAGTVYGGTLDVVSGKLRVDRAMVDLGTLKWEKTGNRFYSTSINTIIRKGSASHGYGNLVCSQYVGANKSSLAQLGDGEISIDSGGNLQLYDSRFSEYTPSETKAALGGVQLVYELAEPVTYNLITQEIKTFYGTNNFWNDAGDTAVVYRADIQKYIDKKTGGGS